MTGLVEPQPGHFFLDQKQDFAQAIGRLGVVIDYASWSE